VIVRLIFGAAVIATVLIGMKSKSVPVLKMALVLLVFVTADGEEPALDGLGGAGEEGSGGTVKVAPSIHGFV